MNHRHLRLLAVLLCLLAAVCAVAVPAFAAEGDDGNGTIVFPTDPAPPTPTPTPTPTPEPTPTPTPTPTPEPTEEPSEEPSNQEEPEPDPTPAPQNGGTVVRATPTPKASRKPNATPAPIQKPNMERPKVELNTTPTMTPSGPNYVTFAQLNLKNNSMSVTLFYLGVCCALLGTAGLGVLIVVLVRRRRAHDSREDIFIEIEEAESRQASAAHISATPELITSPPAHKPISYEPMFTESGRFEALDEPRSPGRHLPEQHGMEHHLQAQHSPEQHSLEQHGHEQHSLGSAGILPPVQPGHNRNAPIMPIAADIYTDEFPLEELKEQAARKAEPAPLPAEEQPKSALPPAKPLASRLRQRHGQPQQEPAQEISSEPAQEAPAPPEQPKQPQLRVPPAPVPPPAEEAASQAEAAPRAEAATQEVPVQKERPAKKAKRPAAKEASLSQEQMKARTAEWPAVKPEKPRGKRPDPAQLSLDGTFQAPEQPAEAKAPEKPKRKKAEPDQISFF